MHGGLPTRTSVSAIGPALSAVKGTKHYGVSETHTRVINIPGITYRYTYIPSCVEGAIVESVASV